MNIINFTIDFEVNFDKPPNHGVYPLQKSIYWGIEPSGKRVIDGFGGCKKATKKGP